MTGRHHRPRRKPAWPGRIHVVCSHRQDGEPKRIRVLQMVADGPSPGGIMITALGGPPQEGHAYSFKCGSCGRHFKISKERFRPLVRALAEMQGTHGDTPVVLDISRVDRAL